MSNSTLATYRDTGIGKWNYRNSSIKRITIHHAACVASLHTFSSILRSDFSVSWNYGISNTGEIGIYVDESNRSWATSNVLNDNEAVTIIVSNSDIGGDWPVSKAAYASLILLCTDICLRNNIEELTYTGTLSGSNLTMHKWFSKKTICPGPYLSSRFSEIASKVNSNIKQNLQIQRQEQTAYSIAVSGNLINKNNINYEYLNPYIVTINRGTKANYNYTKLKHFGVTGVLIEAGSLYNSIHQEVPYRNPKLHMQCKEAEKSKMPFGLYCDVRSRSVQEAEKEIYELSLCIKKYPPKLGVWLHLQLLKSKAINHQIINTYYNNLVNLGLKNKIGFYVTKQELNSIDWKKYQDVFYLWLVEHINTTEQIEQLLTPEFFSL